MTQLARGNLQYRLDRGGTLDLLADSIQHGFTLSAILNLTEEPLAVYFRGYEADQSFKDGFFLATKRMGFIPAKG